MLELWLDIEPVADWPGLTLLATPLPWGSGFFFLLEMPTSVCECQSGRHKEAKKAYLSQRKMSGAASEDPGTRETGRGCFKLVVLSLRSNCCSCSWFLWDNLVSLKRHLKPFLARVSFKWDSIPHKFCNRSKWPRLWRWETWSQRGKHNWTLHGKTIVGIFILLL